MDSDWKEKWTSALRSDKYKQIREQLHDVKGYCCLGVACEISQLAQWDDDDAEGPRYLGRADVLPTQVRRLFGLKSDSGWVRGLTDRQGMELSLVQLNDSGLTFRQIADIIDHFL